MQVHFFETEESCIQAMVTYADNIIFSESNTYIALTGGKSPKKFYEALRSVDLRHVELYIADERYVSNDHVDSNQKMIFDALVEDNAIGSFHAIDTSKSISEAVAGYKKELNGVPNNIFDIFFLGIGPDGHILSLFPGSPVLHDKDFSVVHTTTEIFAVQDRISMTLPYVLQAKHVMLFAMGEEKLRIIQELEKGVGTVEEMPVIAIKDHPSLAIFCVK